jgi:hypothetical protein
MLVFSLACFIKSVEAQTYRQLNSPRVKKNKITNKDRYYRPRKKKKRTRIIRTPQRQVKPRVRQKPKPKIKEKPKLKKRKPRNGSFQYHNLRYLWLNEVLGNTGRRDIRRKRTLREKFPSKRK